MCIRDRVIERLILSDDKAALEQELIRLCDQRKPDLILTTGGTGFSPRDITPEATLAVAERPAFGIAEAVRAASMAITRRAMPVSYTHLDVYKRQVYLHAEAGKYVL